MTDVQITDDELFELEMLLEEQKIDILKDGLINLSADTNPNYQFLYTSLKNQVRDKRGELINNSVAGCILEGSSRSGKTWSGIDFIIWLCTHVEKNCTILVVRETFASFSETLYDDFKRRMDDFGLPHPFESAQIVKQIRIGYNKIKFVGCDKVGKKHGAGSDYVFFNEIMHIPEAVFNQLKMRCRKFWWADYNPSFTDHWVFNKVEPRPDVGFLRTTFRDNQHISPSERNEILGLEPWLPDSYTITNEGEVWYLGKPVDDKNQPPKHPTNWESGTADEYEWRVYGLGLRGSMKGAVIKQMFFIEEWPDIAHTFANDFGFTNDPNALVKYAEDDENIWFEVKGYEPLDTSEKLNDLFFENGIIKNKSDKVIDGELITCDSSDKYTSENKGAVEMVKALRKLNWNVKKVKKTKSVMYWLTSMKKKKIHCVMDKEKLWKHAKKERENYKFKQVQGIFINQPIDKHNHIIDAVRYGHIAHNSPTEVMGTEKTVAEMGVVW